MPSRPGIKTWYRLRFQVLERDNYQCQYCGQYAPNVRLEVDHRVAVADGGSNDLTNLVTACFACNQGKNGLWGLRKARPRKVKARLTRAGSKTPTKISRIPEYLLKHPGATLEEMAIALQSTPRSLAVMMTRLRKRGLLTTTYKPLKTTSINKGSLLRRESNPY